MLDEAKIDVARRQLGTALSLFIADADPVSVHCLACGGGEIADGLAQQAGATAFSQHALQVNADLQPAELQSLRNRYWNAMKHSTTKAGKARNDTELLAQFGDEHNDHALYIGWHDYASAVGRLPIEAQAFQVWYFASYPEKLAPEADLDVSAYFPGLPGMDRSARKRALRKAIGRVRRRRDVMADPRTDRRKLVLDRPQDR